MTLQQQISHIFQEIEYGLDFIINHFDPTILYFPRTIMTKKLGYQKEVFSKEDALEYFQQSNFVDCRINAFRYSNPGDLIFIDIDIKDFKDNKSFENALLITLKNIKNKLNGFPTVLWSGNGYHIIQPIEAIDFENRFNATLSFIKKEFSKDFDLFKEFLRFSKISLSNGKSDPGFNPSPSSCLLRIPSSINGKCLDNKNKRLSGNFKVNIIKEWNSVRSVVPNEYLECFADYLIQKKIETEERKREYNNNFYYYKNYSSHNYYGWIETKVLQTQFSDYRKLIVGLILAPYLILVKKLSYEESYKIIDEWLMKCDSLSGRKLDFDPKYLINNNIKTSMKKLIPPISLYKLEMNYRNLYLLLLDQNNNNKNDNKNNEAKEEELK